MRFSQLEPNDASQRRQVPRAGKIRLGKMVTSTKGKEHPIETKTFIVSDPELAAIIGAEPLTIDATFPASPREILFPTRLAAYGSNQRLKCEGDGLTSVRLDEAKDEWIDRDSCRCEWLTDKRCSRQGMLMIIVPTWGLGATWQIDTSSIVSMININSTIDYLIGWVGVLGLPYVPLTLYRPERIIKGKPHWPLMIRARLTVELLEHIRGLGLGGPAPVYDSLSFVEEGPLPDTPTTTDLAVYVERIPSIMPKNLEPWLSSLDVTSEDKNDLRAAWKIEHE